MEAMQDVGQGSLALGALFQAFGLLGVCVWGAESPESGNLCKAALKFPGVVQV